MFSIQGNSLVTSLEEDVVWNGGYSDEAYGMRHSCSVHFRTKDRDCIVTRHSKSLDPFEGLLSIIQAWSHTVYLEIGIDDECRLGPLSGLDTVVRFDVAIDFLVCQRASSRTGNSSRLTFSHAEANVVPIYGLIGQSGM